MSVFDGHGDDGEYISKACKDLIPNLFLNNLNSTKDVK